MRSNFLIKVFLVAGLIFSQQVHAAYTFIAAACGTPTTAAMNTTGADFIYIVQVSDTDLNGAPTDSKGNTGYTGQTAQQGGGGASNTRGWYKQAPASVGSGHTFTNGLSYGAICAIAFSGSTTTPADVQCGNTETSTPVSTLACSASMTPTQANELVVAGLGLGGTATLPTVASPLTIPSGGSVNALSGTNYGAVIAYEIQTTATARQPSFSWTGAGEDSMVGASFKTAAGASTVVNPISGKGGAAALPVVQ